MGTHPGNVVLNQRVSALQHHFLYNLHKGVAKIFTENSRGSRGLLLGFNKKGHNNFAQMCRASCPTFA
jgi:hypothetical protein